MSHRIAMLFPGCIAPEGSMMQVPALVNLVQHLSTKFDVTVYSIVKPDGDRQDFHCGNATVKYVEARYNDSFWRKLRAFRSSFLQDHRKRAFSVIHGFWGYYCGLISVLLASQQRVPSVVSLLGSETANIPSIHYGNMRNSILRTLTKYSCNKAAALTVLTKFQHDQLKQYGIKRSDIRVIPLGADDSFYRLAQIQRSIHSPVRLLHIGSLNKVKDQETLLRSFALIRETTAAELRIIGEDNLTGELQHLADSLGISSDIRFYGRLRHKCIPEHLEWADILLHTSLHEAQGVVIAEAAASGVPVCGTRIGLIADLGDDAAVSIQPKDYQSLAVKIIDLAKNPERLNSLRTNAREWATAHTMQWTADQYSVLYHSLLR